MWDKPQLLNGLANVLTIAAVLMFLYAAAWFVIHSTGFPIKKVQVSGALSHVTQQQLEYVVQHELKGTFFTLQVDAIRYAFSKLPWVKQVTVYRRWPDTLEVALEEYQVLARWGESGLLDTHGVHFEAASDDVLPTLEGPAGSEKEMTEVYGRFKQILAPLGQAPTHIWLSPRRAWKVALQHDMVIEVGRDDVEARLKRFARAYTHLLAKLNHRKIEYVDLRYNNGFTVKLPSDQLVNKSV